MAAGLVLGRLAPDFIGLLYAGHIGFRGLNDWTVSESRRGFP
jgi:hypothetical protein